MSIVSSARSDTVQHRKDKKPRIRAVMDMPVVSTQNIFAGERTSRTVENPRSLAGAHAIVSVKTMAGSFRPRAVVVRPRGWQPRGGPGPVSVA